MEGLGHVDAGRGVVCLVAGVVGRGSICWPVVENVGNFVPLYLFAMECSGILVGIKCHGHIFGFNSM